MRALLLFCLIAPLGGCAKKSGSAADPNPPADGGATAPGVTGSAGWVEFRHPEGALSASLPAAPQPRTGSRPGLNRPVPVGQAFHSDYFAQADGLYCEFGVVAYSPELVDGVRNAAPPLPPGGKRTALTWAGRPAVEDVSEDGQGHKLFSRRVWVGSRLYYCGLYGRAPGRPTDAERAAVFGSFAPAD